MGMGGLTAAGSGLGAPPQHPGHARHRSARTIAKEELHRSFMANPAIFADESTREYVASLVSPSGPGAAASSMAAAKEHLCAGVDKVARVAALAKRHRGARQAALSQHNGGARRGGRRACGAL